MGQSNTVRVATIGNKYGPTATILIGSVPTPYVIKGRRKGRYGAPFFLLVFAEAAVKKAVVKNRNQIGDTRKAEAAVKKAVVKNMQTELLAEGRLAEAAVKKAVVKNPSPVTTSFPFVKW